MGIIIDGIIVLFVLASIFLGYRKGLIALGISLVSFVITIVAVMVIYRPIGALVINNTQIDEKIQTTIQENVEGLTPTDGNSMVNDLIKSAEQGVLAETSKAIAENVVYGATMLILFIVIRIALIFVTALANLVAKLPILNQFNKAGGVVYGLLRGLLIVYAILLVVNLIVTMNPNGTLDEMLSTSYIAKPMAENNLLSVFF